MNAWTFVSQLKSGWNLGDTMDGFARGEEVTPEQQETAWGKPKTTFEMIKLVKDTGFDILRVPVTWGPQTGPGPDFTIKKAMLERVKEIVDYGIDNGLVVILNMHHEHWHFPSEENYPQASAQLKAMWAQIAEYFAGYDEKLVFESMNEPRKVGTPVEWDEGDEEGRTVVALLNADFIATVRQAGGNNANRMLMVPSYAASCSEGAMADVLVPDHDKNIIVSIHAYMPYEFALGPDMDKNQWSADNEADTAPIDQFLANMHKRFLSKQIPVIIGECGARRKDGNDEARVAWARYYSFKCRQYGVPAVWWDNGAFEQPSEWFGLMDRHHVSWVYPAVVDAFLGKDAGDVPLSGYHHETIAHHYATGVETPGKRRHGKRITVNVALPGLTATVSVSVKTLMVVAALKVAAIGFLSYLYVRHTMKQGKE